MATPFLILKPSSPFLAVFPSVFQKPQAMVPVPGFEGMWGTQMVLGICSLLLTVVLALVLEAFGLITLMRDWFWHSAPGVTGVLGKVTRGAVWLTAAAVTVAYLWARRLDYRESVSNLAKRHASRREFVRTAYVQPTEAFSETAILSLSAPFDEALNLLTGARWAGDAAALVVTVVALVTMFSIPVLAASLTVALSLWSMSLWQSSPTWAFVLASDAGQALFLAVTTCATAVAVAIAGRLVSYAVRIVRRILTASGLDDPSRTLLHRVSVAGDLELPTVDFRTYGWMRLIRGAGLRPTLHHLLLYRDLSVIEEIGDWMVSQVIGIENESDRSPALALTALMTAGPTSRARRER